MWKSAKVQTIAGGRPEDDVLAGGYDLIAEKPRSAQDLVNRLGKGLKEQLADRLTQRGILERHDDKVLGLFPRKRWPARDSTHEEEVRRGLTAALVQSALPDDRTGALIALLSAIDKAHKVVDHEGLSAREVRKRAKEISEGAWAAKAVKDAIAAANAAVMGAVAASTAGATAASN
jgi:hypothetical protein